VRQVREMDKQIMIIMNDINSQCHSICSKNEKINSIVSDFLNQSINEQLIQIEGMNDQIDSNSDDEKVSENTP
jgi:tRNA G26 N,N-dimethylase Trm1